MSIFFLELGCVGFLKNFKDCLTVLNGYKRLQKTWAVSHLRAYRFYGLHKEH
jgi:hypothetical protein